MADLHLAAWSACGSAGMGYLYHLNISSTVCMHNVRDCVCLCRVGHWGESQHESLSRASRRLPLHAIYSDYATTMLHMHRRRRRLCTVGLNASTRARAAALQRAMLRMSGN
jgi:hypothetical protein